MSIKCTFFFDQDKYSWQEDHYLNITSGDQLEAAILPAVQLSTLRVPCLGLGCALRAIRLSSVPANDRVYDIVQLDQVAPTWPAVVGANLEYASRAFTAAQVRLQDALGNHRNYYLAGAPFGLFRTVPGQDAGIDLSAVPAWSSRFLSFMNYLVNGTPGWGWLTRTEGNLEQSVGLVTNALYPGMVGVQVPFNVAGLAIGVQVRVKGWRRISLKAGARLSGVYSIGGILAPNPPAVNWTYFLLNTGTVLPTNFFTLGSIGLLELAFTAYNTYQLVQCTERKRGATAYRPRGRSRTR